MEKVYERCCGLDVHKKTVVACLPPHARRQGAADKRGPHVRHDDAGAAGPRRLAAASGLHARRDGVDRRLLEAGVQHPQGALRGPAGQRPPHQGGAWP